jgi:glycosyltransferase involved in cell wall biosynthesis
VELFMCPSRHLQQSVEALDFGPTCLMRNPVDRRFLVEPPSERLGPPTVLFAGVLGEQKGVMTLIEAFARVRESVPDARLLLAGHGPLEPMLRQRVEALDLRGAVSFKGFVGRDAIAELYRSSHILAVPSIWRENAPVVVSEALACGLPCVGSDIGGIREFLQEGECGLTARPRDPETLAAGMIRLLGDHRLWRRFSANARRYALREFCPDRHRQQILEVARKHARE